MSSESLEEVNRGIAEFMEHDLLECFDPNLGFYHQSLDALVPVWDKLEIYQSGYIEDHTFKGRFRWWIESDNGDEFEGYGKSIQEAAARATYKVIKEMGNE